MPASCYWWFRHLSVNFRHGSGGSLVARQVARRVPYVPHTFHGPSLQQIQSHCATCYDSWALVLCKVYLVSDTFCIATPFLSASHHFFYSVLFLFLLFIPFFLLSLNFPYFLLYILFYFFTPTYPSIALCRHFYQFFVQYWRAFFLYTSCFLLPPTYFSFIGPYTLQFRPSPPSFCTINFWFFFFIDSCFLPFRPFQVFVPSFLSIMFFFFLSLSRIFFSLIFIAQSHLSLPFLRFAFIFILVLHFSSFSACTFYISKFRSSYHPFCATGHNLSVCLSIYLLSLSLWEPSLPSTVDLGLDLKVVNQPVAGFPRRSPRFITRTERVVSVVQILPQILGFPLSITFPPKLHIHSGKEHWARYSPRFRKR